MLIPKEIKKLRNIVVITLLVLIALVVVLFALLHSNKAQNIIADEAAKSLSKKLDTEVSIGNVRYKPFNTFQFEDLFVQDLNKDTLLYVHKTYADFDFWNFFKGKFVFNQIELDGLEGNLIVDSVGVSNLDFVLEAFRKPKKEQKGKESSPVEFNFKDIKITNSSFKLYNLQHPDMANNERFNGSRLAFKDINAKIAVDLLKGDSLAATIHSLSAKERSGLTLENLKTKIYGYRTGFRFPNLSIKLPNSQLEMDSVKMEYDSISGLKDILNSVRWNAVIKPSKIALNDLSPFVPNFSNLKDPVSLQGRLNGRISSFRLKDLEVKYRNSINLKANIDLNGIPNINETFIYADVKDFRANKGETQDFISKITQKPFILPKELTRLGTIKYNGNITGFFSNLVAFGNITTDVGTLKTDILLQFENNMRDVRYNGTAESKSFQLGTLLANKALGKTAFKINTKGSKLHNRSLQGTVKGTVPEIFLNKYIYRNINLDGNYDGTGFDGHLAVNDKNL
ncbi:MAG: AsmA family protein, partial [Bacteroidales bacterium]|nr:AsmA family protein [Bacteroidales bacterium]